MNKIAENLTDDDRAGEHHAALARAGWQNALFATPPSRYRLSQLKPQWPLTPLNIQVYRNHPFEFVAGQVPVFAAYAGFDTHFSYSDYDDTLAFTDTVAGDLGILWLDYSRYDASMEGEQLLDWLLARIARLGELSPAPLLVCNRAPLDERADAFNRRLATRLEAVADTFLCDLSAIRKELGDDYFDERNLALAGSPLSNAACMELARSFGLEWIPAAIAPRLKAIVVDLDNTLYAGVAEEDGIAALRLEDTHRALQERLAALAASGILLAACTKNDPETVQRIFRERRDFPLGIENFCCVSANWASKARGVADIAGKLSIGTDAMLFVDDNPAEIAAVASAHPGIHTLLAGESPVSTVDVLKRFPRLGSRHARPEDSLRAADLRANRLRADIRARAIDDSEYLASLDMKLAFHLNPARLRGRLRELSAKTNRFNTGLRRFSEREIAARLDNDEDIVVAVGLRDRLSDSGIIAALFGHHQRDAVVIDEICISCRALGRELEAVILLEMFDRIMHLADAPDLVVRFTKGPKNATAAQCLDSVLGSAVPTGPGLREYHCQRRNLPEAPGRQYVRILWEMHNA